jgi:hypothetical protein
VIQSALTRNITTKFDELHDEVVQAFEQLIPANEKGWRSTMTGIPSLIESRRVDRHTSQDNDSSDCKSYCKQAIDRCPALYVHSAFLAPVVDPDSGRNTEWVDLSVRFSVDVVIRGVIINAFPRFLFPCVPSPAI